MATLANQGHFNETVLMGYDEELTFSIEGFYFSMGCYVREVTSGTGTVTYEDNGEQKTADILVSGYVDYSDGTTDYIYNYDEFGDILEKNINGGQELPVAIRIDSYTILPSGATILSVDKAEYKLKFYYFDDYPFSYIEGTRTGIGYQDVFMGAKIDTSGTNTNISVKYYPVEIKELIDQKLRDSGLLGANEEKTAYNLTTIPDADFYINWIGTYNYLPHKLNTTYIGSFNEVITNIGEITSFLTPLSQQISTPEDLFNLRYANAFVTDNTKSYELANDIDLTNFTLPSYLEAQMFEDDSRFEASDPRIEFDNLQAGHFPPIYDFYSRSESSNLAINLDGKNYSIKNFTYKNAIRDNIGLFGGFGFYYFEDSGGNATFLDFTIKNLKLENIDIEGRWYVGGLIGNFEGSGGSNWHIDNVQVEGIVKAGDECGGLIGYGVNSFGDNWVDQNIKVRKSSFSGTLNGGYYTGGLAAYSEGYFENCYAKGNFTDNSKIAGLIGEYYPYTNDDKIKNCYFAGTLNGTGTISPLINGGSNDSLINCYYDSDLMGDIIFTNKYANEKPKTTSEMTYPYQSNDIYIGWEFSELPDPVDYNYPSTVDFANDSTEEIINKLNEGYPALGPPGTIWIPMRPFIAIGEGFVEFGGNFFWVKKNDTWNTAEGFVKSGGSWHPITLADVKKGGSWD